MTPKLFTVLKEGYSLRQFTSDAAAGILVGILALPLAIAFAIASGVKPEQGLYTAVVAGLVVSVLGGSRVQISGPTGAFIVVIYGIVQQYGYNGLVVATVIAGFLLIAMGFARMGALLRLIPYPVTVGFTSGIALIIFSSQLGDLLGLSTGPLPADLIEKYIVYGEHVTTANGMTLAVGLGSLAILIVWPRLTHAVPAPLVALAVMTAGVQILGLPVDTVGTRFGSVPNSLPTLSIPSISWDLVTTMFGPGLTIALLAGIESLLSAVVADGMIGTRHRSNMELVAQGVGNVLSPLFGGIPATGAIARTASNIKAGGRTPVSGIVHSITVLLLMIVFGEWASYIPMASLAAVLVVVAYNMSEWRACTKIFRGPRSDMAILLTTFLLTVFIDLTVAIEAGVVLSAFLFLRQMVSVSQAQLVTRDLEEREEESDDPLSITRRSVPQGVEVFEIYGSLFYAAVDQFKESLRTIKGAPRVLILRTRHLLAIDATGLRALEDLLERTKRDGTTLVISGIHKQPLHMLSVSGLMERIGPDNVCGNIDEALERARAILGGAS
ncbi:MAG: sodium-independent anion transporter [Bacteroidia bacterium]|nr:MAG: sodium-independent anion transporter [Bacteroidia bacterium]